jgi:rSAM/selenodomain-associated transferase 1
MSRKQLGIFVRCPSPGQVKTRLTPPLSPDQAFELYRAFLSDLSRRVAKPHKYDITVFYSGDDPDALEGLLPARAALEPQQGDHLGERLHNAFGQMLQDGASDMPAVIIGSDSPDLPVTYIRRAFQKLRHRDVVLGPATDGGYYLVGLKSPAPGLFEEISWGEEVVYEETLRAIEQYDLTMGTLPYWYDVDSFEGLRTLRSSVHARVMEKRDRLVAIEEVLGTFGPQE